MARNTTLQDIARHLNVNAATVSRALNNHPAISAETKDAVQRAARRLRYQPNRVASSLRLGKTRILGVMIPSAEINFFGSVIHGIEKVASEQGYNVLIYQSNESEEWERRGVDTFLRSQVDGVLASIAKQTTDNAHWMALREQNIPLVLFDRVNAMLPVPSVSIDDRLGAFRATSHLAEQGYRHIAFIGGQAHVPIWQERLDGYRAALKAHGLRAEASWIKHGDVSIESGAACMQQLLKGKKRPDAVCCVEDFTALGALQVLRQHGISVPADMGLVGFANETFGAHITPSLTTVDQQTIRMGEEAARLFFEVSAGTDFYAGEPRRLVLEPQLLVRESSKRNPI
ncbi:LacI family DNA-binding transcriptional regulator [Flaviaesturariibacter aridisoli]|uniref:LacI family transcriptional regulator n=1 Tax=Flaviaesturariibacter aridisoli TaxID=2545761 RepID=A0A4R4E0C5_9BACT|nr:LacI family DNA-binding transcriptional regulator [Flaviaesturariibacter aridisoli]TCZ70595.1 LacI family transcriptional regulator [Flaviaesturariibacter aridisoli]